MPSISFPRTNSIAQNQSKKTNLEDKQSQIEQEHPLLFAANYNTRERKNELLTKMLTDNLVNKSGTEIKDYCIKELMAVSCIVDAHGNKVNADNNLRMSALGLNDNHVSNLLALFGNRDTGLFGRQNINRTAAKYVEVLRQTLQTVDRNSFTTDLSVQEQRNLNLVRDESNKWYRSNYIMDISVTKYQGNLIVTLGNELGRLTVPINLKQDHLPIYNLRQENISGQLVTVSGLSRPDQEKEIGRLCENISKTNNSIIMLISGASNSEVQQEKVVQGSSVFYIDPNNIEYISDTEMQPLADNKFACAAQRRHIDKLFNAIRLNNNIKSVYILDYICPVDFPTSMSCDLYKELMIAGYNANVYMGYYNDTPVYQITNIDHFLENDFVSLATRKNILPAKNVKGAQTFPSVASIMF